MCNKQVGLIRPDHWNHLQAFSDVFVKVDQTPKNGYEKQGVHLSAAFTKFEDRTSAVNDVLQKLRKSDAIASLRGWRHEVSKILTFLRTIIFIFTLYF